MTREKSLDSLQNGGFIDVPDRYLICTLTIYCRIKNTTAATAALTDAGPPGSVPVSRRAKPRLCCHVSQDVRDDCVISPESPCENDRVSAFVLGQNARRSTARVKNENRRNGVWKKTVFTKSHKLSKRLLLAVATKKKIS